ncbi:cytochrome C [Deinococcus cavernae]|uniref:Cytochrome C n=1 Tax=Deinococcus cavernae TaxID=2320857 RepID=A0A418VA91_9DEIO|nr:c-type cytochrome [Deinococcus cavernae]RJF73025.1 cytochrome C [Deinococcus cavernae]
MKNTFAVTMTLLLLATVASSVFAYHKATTPHEAAAHAPAAEGAAPAAAAHTEGAAGEHSDGEVTGTQAGTEAEQNAQGETQTAPTNAGTTANAGTPGVDNTNAAGATGNAPADTASAANATEPAGDPAIGKTKFAAACAGCHGANAEGGAIGPKLNAVKDWTQEQFKTALRDGNTPTKTLAPPMMKFDTTAVTDDEVAGIYAWLKTVD